MSVSLLLRVVACIAFGLATFGVLTVVNLVALGLALWVGSTFIA